MHSEDTLLEFSIIPMGGNGTDSISPTVTKAVKRIKTSGLPSETHAMGTLVEADLNQCLDLVKACIRDALGEVPRVTASIRLDVRPGHSGRIHASVQSGEEKFHQTP